MEAIVGDLIDPVDFQNSKKNYDEEETKGYVSKETRFQYARCLVRSKTDDIKKGIVLLGELNQKPMMKPAMKGNRRDVLLYLSVAYYRLNEYEKALRFIRALLRNKPEDEEALEMETLIKKSLTKDGLFGMAIVGAIGLGVAGLASLIASYNFKE